MTESKAQGGRKPQLLVVSNRLPLSLKRTDDGKYESSKSSGGLVTSLSGISESIGFQWFGWTGLEISEDEQQEVQKLLAKQDAVPIFLNKELANNHYNGFSSEYPVADVRCVAVAPEIPAIIAGTDEYSNLDSILWPVLHYQPGTQHFDEKWWDAYQEVNQIFAKVVAEATSDGDLVWVHDYHLMLLPGILRREFVKQGKHSVKIGFSLHTPFPAAEVYRALPTNHELLEGVLDSDLIGFHTDDYAGHFADACSQILGASKDGLTLRYKDRTIQVGKFIVGIDPTRFLEAVELEAVQKRIAELEDKYKGIKRIVGVDRLDYIKGLPEKLRGYQEFLRTHPEWVGKIVLIQIAVPSREDVQEYQELEAELYRLVGMVNGEFGKPDYAPVIFIHQSIPFEELAALYAASDICLLSSTRDGMNLVALEYIACQKERNGVLAVSEFAGVSSYLEGGVKFNPFNSSEIARVIYDAVEMDTDQRKKEHARLLEFIKTHTSTHWGQGFVEKLSAA
ncbi:alpha,alpha-trehalose-phosphate synthase subunit [Trichophyton rubrum]|uniref:Alpha,alpha-trehalose-phosphate synthase subunit n=1 Tax=Trichophyton rubrum TaxID=5551 RepID=A0A178F8P7_TRIRU|nr:alpha,alpha-trehalose-phosphate synthase subunit [Trichophyton rubrum]